VQPSPPGADGAAQRLVVGTLPLVDVMRWARIALRRAAAFELEVPDPDDAPGASRPDEGPHRTWRAWVDFAEVLGCRCHVPERLAPGVVRVRFTTLPPEAAWHGGAGDVLRYGVDAPFASVRKLEQPGFLVPLLEALERVRPPDGGRVLVLGCHRGDEIEALRWLEPPPRALAVTGVDRAAGALEQARARFPAARFVDADVNDLPETLGRFHLVVAIDVLQSPGVDDKAVLRGLVQRHLEPEAALLLGLPNSRFRGGEVVWGARTKNYRASDLSLAVRDLAAYRRYLQQHGFTTHVGGRYDLLLGAWRRA
jgi:SAM-dependent methyltransferase